MCGIAAAFAYRESAPSPNAETVRRISERMACRGPDGHGLWTSRDGRVVLDHRRLSIIDLSESGAQPMRAGDESCVISFNGEIYNYRELRRELEARGRRFVSSSDTEVLLQLYAEYGEQMVSNLRGMFAFALWDERRARMVLARDTFGIKPLYYVDDGAAIYAASEVKALRAAGIGSAEPSAAGEVGFFLFGCVPEPFTIYRDVRALTPGSVMVIERGKRGVERSFNSVVSLLTDVENPLHGNTADTARAAVLESVRYHLVSDVPVGVFLSSGIDSTTLAALAAEVGSNLRTVTLGFDEYRGTSDDETVLAEQVARQLGAHHQTIRIGRADFDKMVDRFFDRMDQPTTDGLNSYFVSDAAARAGLKVALSGLGGDELFGGYPSFAEIPRLVRTTARIPGAATLGRAVRRLSAPLFGSFTSPKYASVLEYGGSFGSAYLLRRGLYLPWELESVLGRDSVERGLNELSVISRIDDAARGLASGHAKVSALEASVYMRNQLLRDSDWASMSHGVEIRVPLVDVELWRALAPLMRNGSLSKRTLAQTARPSLPDRVLNRPKTGFTTPLRRWIADRPEFGHAARGYRQWARAVHARYLGVNLSSTRAAPTAAATIPA